jgi:AcrR family transcriptional regulator
MNNSKVWINVGYELFAREGYESLQVERMARILGLNKSGFYHYFSDRNFYLNRLLRYHDQCVDRMLEKVGGIETFDPEYLQIMIDHPLTVMANRQLSINHRTDLFENTLSDIKQKMEKALLPVWAEYVGMPHQPNLALRYFRLMQDAFYTRLSFDRLRMDYLHEQTSELKMLIGTVLTGDETRVNHRNALIS